MKRLGKCSDTSSKLACCCRKPFNSRLRLEGGLEGLSSQLLFSLLLLGRIVIYSDMLSTAGTDSTAAQSSLATVVTKRTELVTALESLKGASVPQTII